MKITLSNIGKRFNSEWIFKNINYEFEPGGYVILGANGSGKSTLLQLIAGSSTFSEGSIDYKIQTAEAEKKILSDNVFQYLSYAAPYLELYEEYTLKEAIVFHQKFKPFFKHLAVEDIISTTNLVRSTNKQLKYFSSGMKQRVKLALAVLSDVPVLLLDEPCSNLDREGVEWYQKLIDEHYQNRLILVCSNHQKEEYVFCKKELLIENYK